MKTPAAAAWLPPPAALERDAPPGGDVAPDHEEAGQQRRYGFRAGGLGLLIASDGDSEAISTPAITPIPNSVPWLRGMLNLRGALVPVFDLARVLGSSAPAGRQPMVLVLGKGVQAVGMITDGYPMPLQALSRVAQRPELPAALKAQVAAAYTQDGDVWFEFDHEAFFLSLSHVKQSH